MDKEMTGRSKIGLKAFLFFGFSFFILEILMNLLGLREKIFNSSIFFGENLRHALFLSLLVCIASSASGMVLAKRKRRGPVKWALICFVANVWGVVILAFLNSKRKPCN